MADGGWPQAREGGDAAQQDDDAASGRQQQIDRVLPYARLRVWQRSHEAAVRVFNLTRSFPAEEKYGLAAQLRRAAFSVPTNVAEGSKRVTPRDFAHFVNMAEGSAAEAGYLLQLSTAVGLLTREEASPLAREYDAISAMLYALRRRVRR